MNRKKYSVAGFTLAKNPATEPLKIEYSDPIFNHLDDWNIAYERDPWVVIPENYTETDWVWLVILGGGSAHPIHLHGHDFAILQTAENTEFSNSTFKPKRDNPPRRDVVLVPPSGFAVIALRTDNPGSWLMHCHIARHAAMGLAMQILERQAAANEIWKPGQSRALDEARRLCVNWNKWVATPTNWWPSEETYYQDDSGI